LVGIVKIKSKKCSAAATQNMYFGKHIKLNSYKNKLHYNVTKGILVSGGFAHARGIGPHA
jgi:hypothetical protein